MASFVLVHGAWHGGWCWPRVAEPLRMEGHAVFTPTLTGLGERAHLASADIDLDTHIADIMGVIEAEELDRVVLCGHSYSGMVITGVADAMPERLAALVFLDAFLPENGRAQLDYVPEEMAQSLRAEAATEGQGWQVGLLPDRILGIEDPADLAWVHRRATKMPLGCMEQPITLNGMWRRVPVKEYIRAAHYPGDRFAQFSDPLLGDPEWTVHEVECGHEVMIDRPKELVDLLLGAARRAGVA